MAAGVAPSVVQVGAIVKIERRLIRPFADQPRKHFNAEELRNLAESIAEIGQRTPVCVRPISDDPSHQFELIDGERRFQACGLKNIPTMIAEVRTVASADDQFLQSVVPNFGRAGHTPLETARAIQRIKLSHFGPTSEYGAKVLEKLAKIFAHSPAWVHQHLSLLKLDPRVQALMDPSRPDAKRLKFQVAIALANLPPARQCSLAAGIVGRELKLKQALGFVRTQVGSGEMLRKRGRRRGPYALGRRC